MGAGTFRVLAMTSPFSAHNGPAALQARNKVKKIFCYARRGYGDTRFLPLSAHNGTAALQAIFWLRQTL
jgi:hypothetical protein